MARALAPKDIYAIKCVGDPQLSPDGKLLAYTVLRIDEEKDKGFTDIYLADLDSGKTRRLTNSGKDGSPRFSPDGRRIAFVSSRSDKSQLWIIDVAGGEAWLVPTAEAVVGAPVWFPDGKCIAYNANVFSHPEGWQPYPGAPEYDAKRLMEIAKQANEPDKKSDDNKKKNEVKVITRLHYRHDGVGYFGDLRRQVFVTPVPDAAPSGELKAAGVQVTKGDFDFGAPTVSPDGRYLVVDVHQSEWADYEHKRDLWLYDIERGEGILLYRASGPTSSPLWSPDGRTIAFEGNDFSRNVSTTDDLWLLDVSAFMADVKAGQRPAPLTQENAINVTRPFDRPFGAHNGSELRGGGGNQMFWAGSELYFLMSDRGAAGIHKTDARGRVTPVLVDPSRAISGITGDGKRLVYLASQVDKLEDIFLHDGGAGHPLTHVNDEFLAEVEFARWEKFTYNSTDGTPIDGWIIYPNGYETGVRYPLMLMIHGGPHGAYGPGFTFMGQLFASRGYAVLFTNPRGSTTYGQDFTCAIDKNWGVIDYADLMAGVDAVIARGLADPQKLFVQGWSFGGYMTCWIVTQTNRFRAACGGASVTNLLSDYGVADILWADEWEYGGQPWKDAEHLLSRSPLTHVEKVSTPLLLLHGESDLRVFTTQSDEFYAALKRLKKEVVMVRYPGEYHGLRRPIHRVDRYERTLAWFEHYNKQ